MLTIAHGGTNKCPVVTCLVAEMQIIALKQLEGLKLKRVRMGQDDSEIIMTIHQDVNKTKKTPGRPKKSCRFQSVSSAGFYT